MFEFCEANEVESSSAMNPPDAGAKTSRQQFKDAAAAAKQEVQVTNWIVKKYDKGKSDVWKTFGIVVDKLEGKYKGFAVCSKCNEYFSYKLGGATSTLNRHIPHCTPAIPIASTVNNSCSAIGGGNSAGVSSSILSVHEWKARITGQAVDLSCVEMRPFHMFDGCEFINLVDMYVQAGRQHPQITARQITPCSTTISRKVEDRADQLRLQILPEVRSAMAGGFAALTTDMWLEDFTKHDYLVVTVHYLREKTWQKVNQVLFCSMFPEDLCHSGEHIREVIRLECSLIGITEEHLSNSTFISDNGPNVVKALQEFTRQHCMAHALNIVLSTTVVAKLKDIDLLGLFGNEFIDKIKAVTSYLVDKKLVTKLSSELVTGATNLPRSLCKTFVPMLSSLDKNYVEVKQLMAGNSLINDIQREDIQEVRNFLKVIEDKAVKHATHGLYLPPYQHPSLLEHFAERESDSFLMREIRLHCESEFAFMEASHMIERCKSLVSYVKLVADYKLASAMNQPCEPRWNSNQPMLESVASRYDEIKDLLRQKKQTCKMDGITREKLQALIDFLLPFGREISRIQADKEPTLHLGLLSYLTLREHCSPLPIIDCPMVSSLKARSQFLLDMKWTVTDDHRMALFLFPDFRSMVMLSPTERSLVHETTRRTCQTFEWDIDEENLEGPTPAKRVSDGFDKWRDVPSSSTDLDEVALYLLEPVPPPYVDTISWWREREHRYPRLSKVARQLLARPVTSASAERAFSLAGNIINKRTSTVDPKRVNNMMFVNSALRNS